MFCPLKLNPTAQDCKECQNECLNFNLLVVCEHPDNVSALVPKLKKMLVNQHKVNVFVNALETNVDGVKDLIPKIDKPLEKYFDEDKFNLIIFRSFTDDKFLDLIRMIIDSTGGGVVIYGSNNFMYTIQRKFNEEIMTHKMNDQSNIIKKLKFRFVEEKIKANKPIVGQQSLF